MANEVAGVGGPEVKSPLSEEVKVSLAFLRKHADSNGYCQVSPDRLIKSYLETSWAEASRIINELIDRKLITTHKADRTRDAEFSTYQIIEKEDLVIVNSHQEYADSEPSVMPTRDVVVEKLVCIIEHLQQQVEEAHAESDRLNIEVNRLQEQLKHSAAYEPDARVTMVLTRYNI